MVVIFTLQKAVTTVSMVGILASVGSSAGYVGYEYVTSDGISGDEALVMLDQWMAGYAHGVSGGITTAVRREDYEEIQEGDHAFLWNMGNLAGVSTSFILGFQLPMAMAGQIGGAKWATTFAGGLAGVSEAYGAYEAGKGLTDGVWEYSDVFNLLSLVPYAVPVVAGVGKTLGTLRRNAKVADDVGGALSQVDNVLDDVGETRTAVDLQGTGACFVAGTEILTPDGAVDIEDIEVGDWVIADDPTTPGEIEKRQVLQTFVKEVDGLIDLYVDGEVISTTEENPFWVVDKGWVEAEDLEVGDLLQTEDGIIVDIDGIEEREGEFEVYNFEVEDFHTYFVSDLEILVHNSCYNPNHPNRIDPSTLDINDLINASGEPIGKGGLTKAGRALDKHAAGQRGSSPFPSLTGNNTNKNSIAEQQEQVREILNHPDVVFVRLGRGGVEARVPDGRGIRFEADGSFNTFVD